MREILFRGKHIHALMQNRHLDGTWVYGYLCDESYINVVDEDEYGGKSTSEMLVNPETVCQYTGLMDKNGRKIFEGDIVRENLKGLKLMDCKVVWDKEEGAWMSESESGARYGVGNVNSQNLEVIGNIFDNPELLKGDKE